MKKIRKGIFAALAVFAAVSFFPVRVTMTTIPVQTHRM